MQYHIQFLTVLDVDGDLSEAFGVDDAGGGGHIAAPSYILLGQLYEIRRVKLAFVQKPDSKGRL